MRNPYRNFKPLACTVHKNGMHVSNGRTHARTDNPKPKCPVNFFDVGGIEFMKLPKRASRQINNYLCKAQEAVYHPCRKACHGPESWSRSQKFCTSILFMTLRQNISSRTKARFNSVGNQSRETNFRVHKYMRVALFFTVD